MKYVTKINVCHSRFFPVTTVSTVISWEITADCMFWTYVPVSFSILILKQYPNPTDDYSDGLH